jgi:Big-like domain-containing protein
MTRHYHPISPGRHIRHAERPVDYRGLVNPAFGPLSRPSREVSYLLPLLLTTAAPVFATVNVTSPASGSTVNSPVQYVATATTSTCANGVASMGIYVNNKLTCVVNGARLNTSLTLNPGPYNNRQSTALLRNSASVCRTWWFRFVRKHYVSHIPMDHTAVIKFVENRFIGSSAHLTARDAAQPNLLDFFDFQNVPWATPPTPPSPVTAGSLGYNPCTPTNMGP